MLNGSPQVVVVSLLPSFQEGEGMGDSLEQECQVSTLVKDTLIHVHA